MERNKYLEEQRYSYTLNKTLYQIRKHGIGYLNDTIYEIVGIVNSEDLIPISAYCRDRKLNAGKNDYSYMATHIRRSTIEKWRKAIDIVLREKEENIKLLELKSEYEYIINKSKNMKCSGICHGCPINNDKYIFLCNNIKR